MVFVVCLPFVVQAPRWDDVMQGWRWHVLRHVWLNRTSLKAGTDPDPLSVLVATDNGAMVAAVEFNFRSTTIYECRLTVQFCISGILAILRAVLLSKEFGI